MNFMSRNSVSTDRIRTSRTMKTASLFGQLLTALVLTLSLALADAAQAAPKKLLVVTVTKGFRHSSIPTAEKVLGELAEKTGIFTVDYARVEPTDPQFKNADG